MRMNNIHNHPNPHAVSRIDQRFQFLGSPEPGTHGKEISYLITKGTIIRVFLHGHQLYRIIPQIHDPRQHEQPEFGKSRYSPMLRGHSDMSLVNQWILGPFRTIMSHLVRILRIPYLRTIYFRVFILYNPSHVRRQTLAASPVPFHEQTVKHLVDQHLSG